MLDNTLFVQTTSAQNVCVTSWFGRSQRTVCRECWLQVIS